MADLISLTEALAAVRAHVRPLPAEAVSLREAAGRVLGEDVRAVIDLPPFPSSAMDGFAVRAGDTPGRLPVVARVAAGVPPAEQHALVLKQLRGGCADAKAERRRNGQGRNQD